MTREARLMSGIILITVPTIQYGGYFLLTSLMNKGKWLHGESAAAEFLSRRARPRGRHRDSFAGLPDTRGRSSASRPSPLVRSNRRAVALIYAGAVILALTVVTLGIGLLRHPA
jgi:ABC-type multidrug transport system permease subunit